MPLIQSLLLSVLLLAPQVVCAKEKRQDREPEAATGITVKSAINAKHAMVSAANPYASKVGLKILKQGGSAVDAAIAIQLVLTLVEPQSSGIGGGNFMLYWDNENQFLTSFNGRETAPNNAISTMFLDSNGNAIPWIEAVVGGRSVGVPGVLASLKAAHTKYGKLPWEQLFSDAIKLAEDGFIVSPRLAKLVAMKFNPGIDKLPTIREYFFPDGKAIKAGQILKNPKLAHVYRSIAKDGIGVFYQGWLAKKMVDAVQNSLIAPGYLSLNDLKNYKPQETKAVCGPYRQYKICGMAPPSSGGITVIQILAQLSQFNISQLPINGIDFVHLFSQSSRLAYADRNRYIADPDFVDVPVEGLISKNYLKKRAALINRVKDMGKAQAGEPFGSLVQADDNAFEMPSTSHLAIIDTYGNAVSMTSSIEMGFGSAVMVEGFILNNQLTDFSLSPKRDGKLVANRLTPKKRPRSSMAPMIVFDENNKLKLVIGSPGGSRIINYVAQTIIAHLDWQLDIQSSINLPRITNRNQYTTLEADTDLVQLKSELEAKGHDVKIQNLNSGIHAIAITEHGLTGGADPRREGIAIGF